VKLQQKQKNNPLHVSIFPTQGDKQQRTKLDYSFMLSTCLDIFEARLPEKNVGQDFGLLQAIDERLAMYGWLTNTGVKLVIIVDMEARQFAANEMKNPPVLGLKNSDLTPVSVSFVFFFFLSFSFHHSLFPFPELVLLI
jgi:hypothetical protein